MLRKATEVIGQHRCNDMCAAFAVQNFERQKISTHTGFEPVTLEYASRNRPVVTAPRANHCTNGSSLIDNLVTCLYH